MSRSSAIRPVPKPDFILGLDLGQCKDYTALAVLERRFEWPSEESQRLVKHYFLRHLKRWQLRTSYPDIVADVKQLVQTPLLGWPMLAIDETGVGVAVVDMFRKAQIKARLDPIVIHGGHTITYEGKWHLPKKELVSTMQMLFQTRRIKIAAMPETEALVKELDNFKAKININGHETFESWRERDHDDLVLAVALAAWLAERGVPYETASGIDERPRPGIVQRVFGNSLQGFPY